MSDGYDLDAHLDTLAAEGLLKQGKLSPARIASLFPEAEVDAALSFVPFEVADGKLPWSDAQDAVIRQHYGHSSPQEIVDRVNAVLHRELGTTQYSRNFNSIAARIHTLDLVAWAGNEDEIHLKAAGRLVGLSFELLHAADKGELPTRKEGRYRFVKKVDLANWYVRYRERQFAQSELLDALEDVELVTKKEAMEITGLGETHITRYLQSHVIRAWQLPTLTGPIEKGEWLVSRQSAEIIREVRQSGKLKEFLRQFPEYQKIQSQNAKEVLRLRRQNRLGQRDPLAKPGSRLLPGCFTIKQLANHLGTSAQILYDWIKKGMLSAKVATIHGRSCYGIPPDEAHRFAEWFRQNSGGGGPGKHIYREIEAAGLLHYPALAKRWGLTVEQAASFARKNRIPHGSWGQIAVFEPQVIADFEAMKRYDRVAYKKAAEAGLWLIKDIKEQWGKSEGNVRAILERHHVPFVWLDRFKAYRPADIEAFRQNPALYPTSYQQKIKNESDTLWFIKDLAERWKMHRGTARAKARRNHIRSVRIGGLLAFDPADIEAFEQTAATRPRSWRHRQASEQGLWLTADLARRWQMHPASVRALVASHGIPVIRFGRLFAFHPAEIEAFERTLANSGKRGSFSAYDASRL